MRRRRFPWIGAVIAVLTFASTTIESASAHDEGCDGNPVPGRIKLDCCAETHEHQLKPEQIRRGPDDEYIVSFEDCTFVISVDKALPSNDHCSHIFFNTWSIDGGSFVHVYCFLTPLNF
jgi:hypothetical protein